MLQMELARREIEVKLPYASVAAARDALSGLGATVTRARHFEENALFDRDAALKNSRRMLRVRQVDDEAWLFTYKYISHRPITIIGIHSCNFINHIHASDHFSKNSIIAI